MAGGARQDTRGACAAVDGQVASARIRPVVPCRAPQRRVGGSTLPSTAYPEPIDGEERLLGHDRWLKLLAPVKAREAPAQLATARKFRPGHGRHFLFGYPPPSTPVCVPYETVGTSPRPLRPTYDWDREEYPWGDFRDQRKLDAQRGGGVHAVGRTYEPVSTQDGGSRRPSAQHRVAGQRAVGSPRHPTGGTAVQLWIARPQQ